MKRAMPMFDAGDSGNDPSFGALKKAVLWVAGEAGFAEGDFVVRKPTKQDEVAVAASSGGAPVVVLVIPKDDAVWERLCRPNDLRFGEDGGSFDFEEFRRMLGAFQEGLGESRPHAGLVRMVDRLLTEVDDIEYEAAGDVLGISDVCERFADRFNEVAEKSRSGLRFKFVPNVEMCWVQAF